MAEEALFAVPRNPQDESKLPYLLRLPLGEGLLLKARELAGHGTRLLPPLRAALACGRRGS